MPYEPAPHDHAVFDEDGASWFAWIAFNALIGAFLWLDIRTVQNENTTVARAARLSAFWVGLAFAFAGLLWLTRGGADAATFLVGYLVEKSLSVDNLLVILLIFKHFRIRPGRQPRVLQWGILGAIVMRAAFIFAGIELLERFEWAVYIFGALLLFAAVKMFYEEDGDDDGGGGDEVKPSNSLIVKVLSRIMPYTTNGTTTDFFLRTHQTNRLVATPMFAALLVVETCDVVFAVDSIPCILGLTHDRFLVYTSNMLAILGLRSLYVLLADALHRVKNLQTGLALVLGFVGLKMMLSELFPVPQPVAVPRNT